jgi:hypothetical protein
MENRLQIALVTPVPKGGLIHLETAAWCARQAVHANVEWTFSYSDSPDQGRNAAIEQVLASGDGVTHVCCVDADTVPPAGTLARLLGLCQRGWPVVSGVTPILLERDGHWRWNVHDPATGDWWRRAKPLPAGPFPTRKVGGSCLLIARAALERVGWPWFQRQFQPLAQGNPVKQTGDAFFCDRCAAVGIPILAEPALRCEHYKGPVPLLAAYESAVREDREYAAAAAAQPAVATVVDEAAAAGLAEVERLVAEMEAPAPAPAATSSSAAPYREPAGGDARRVLSP